MSQALHSQLQGGAGLIFLGAFFLVTILAKLLNAYRRIPRVNHLPHKRALTLDTRTNTGCWEYSRTESLRKNCGKPQLSVEVLGKQTAKVSIIGHHKITIRLLALSRWNFFPGGMTVVALYSVMMAGPGYFLPGWSSSLW
jgi:hypothetical protein